MRQDSTQADGSVALTSGPAGGAGAAQADSPLLAQIAPLRVRFRVPRTQVALGPVAGKVALAALILGALAVTVFATAQPSTLVPGSYLGFPPWESGPLHGLFGHIPLGSNAINLGVSAVVVAMGLAYGAALLAARTLSMRTIVICILALHAILLLSPPFQLTDLFNYLGYARLGGLHHLNPYTHVIAAESHDPVYRFSTWHHLNSPYGPLFTVVSYPVSWLPIPVAYWVLKVAAVLASLGFIALVWRCAQQLGRDPRFVVLFVAANPIYLIYAIGGFHNDFFMLVPSTAAIALLLARRDRAAGAAVMIAVAVKFTAILLLPFLLVAARPAERRLRVLAGAALATVPLALMYLFVFGFTVPNLQDQSTLLTDWSVPNLVGLVIGVGGGTPLMLRVANVVFVVAVVFLLRRSRDWLSGAGWSTLALLASLAWLVPWYIIWVLPLAALGASARLRRAALAFTAFLVFAFIPATGIFLSKHGISPLNTAVGHASQALQKKLER